jgi:hypothetical protein
MTIFSSFLIGEWCKFGRSPENGFKALVISKTFSSLLIGCVRHSTPRTDKGSSSITDNLITFNGISVLNLNLSNILFNKSIICRKVLFSMHYVTFSWATGGIKIWAKCHFIYYILRSYCWSRRPSTITKQSSPLKPLG